MLLNIILLVVGFILLIKGADVFVEGASKVAAMLHLSLIHIFNGDDIGIIQVQDMCSYVDILNGKGKSVAQRLNNTLIKGRTMKVEIANRKM